MDWSPQQSSAIDQAAKWLKEKNTPIFRIFGYAGTGKTTLAKSLAETVNKVCFCSFTGKAALVMQKSGCSDATTIHSLIYETVQDEETGKTEFVLNPRSDAGSADLIVVDECSMVDEDLGKDLLSFKTPILVLGDPAQLPPVKGGGFFTDHEPDIMLTEIHRQAKDNPIVHMATEIREGRSLDYGTYGESRIISATELKQEPDIVVNASQILVGKNITRTRYNRRLREIKGFTGTMPQKDDRLVCLKNFRPQKLLNGSLWIVSEVAEKKTGHIEDNCIKLWILSEDQPGRKAELVTVRREFFDGDPSEIDWKELRGTQEFDFGYALTVHKSQGSQWDDLVLFDESLSFRESARRWLYTGITRASQKITIVR